MKNFKQFSKARWLLASCLLLLIFSTNAWGAMELANINFKSWTPQSISAGSTVNGCYFKSAVTITAAKGATFGGNATTSTNWVAIPLSGINGSITITLTHASSRPQWKNYFKGLNAAPSSSDLSSNPSSVGDNTRPGSNTTTSSWTINTDKLYGVFYVGKGSNGLNDIYSITITTPDWTYYYRGADNSWGGTAMTNSSAGFYSYKSSTTNNHQFKIAKSADGWDYNHSFVDPGYLGTSISSIGDYGSDNCYIWSAPASYYIIVFRPGSPMNTTANPKICASATLPAEKFTISFNNGGGSGSMSSISNVLYASDKATTANTFTKDGYRFTGWHANVDVKVGGATKTAGTLLDDEVTIQEIKSDITLTAQWEVDDGCNKIFWFANSADAETNGVKNNTTTFSGVNTGTSAVTGSITIDGKTYTATGRGSNNATTITFTVPASKVGTLYGLANSSGNSARTLTLTNTASYSETQSTSASSSTAGAFTFADMPAGSYSLAWSGNGAENMLCLKLCDAGVVCTATQPGALNKGTLSGCSRTITASGSAASNNTWYWQSSASGTDKSDAYSSGKAITEAGTYYLRSFCSDGAGCWSDAVSVEITTADMTPAAPAALTAASHTAKGTTFTVTDGGSTNNYEFYVSTSSSAPGSGTSASYTATSTTKTITNLVAGTTYYAWARAKCGSNKSAWTALTGSTFTTSTVSAAYHLTNVSKTSGAESGIGGSTFTAVFSANTDYSMPTPVVTIGGNAATSGTDYTWTEGTGTLTIAKEKITGIIDITLNSVPSAPSSAVISGTYHYFPGDNISLTCTPSGNNGPTTYQWYKGGKADGNRIDGATSATYTKNSCAFADAGSYYCKVTCNETSIWANTNSYENYDVKILRLYVNGSKSGEPYGNVDFTKVDGTTATASIALGSGWTYGFNIADGCGHYYGNAGTMQENNCTNWTTNVNGTDCGLTTTNAATYIFTINYSSLEAIVTSVTYPVGNQAADKVIYFDNNVLKWTGSSIYYRIGHSSHSQASQLSLVSGTANLYKMTTSEYNGFSGWHIANATGDVGSGKSIYKTVDGTPITEATAHEGGAVTQEAITVTPTTSKGYGADVGVNDNCEFYNYTITTGMKTDNVAISPYSNGTITVNYINTSGSAATLTSGNADLAHSVILTSITAVADEGYDASAITINGGAYSANYVVTGNTTIAASFTLKTYTISYNKGTNGTGSKASETKTHGVNFTLPGSTFTYDGHAQDGWSTSDGGALAYALSGSYTTNAAQEFFPHWKCNTPTITDNGDNTVSITVPSGTTVRYTTDGTDPSSSTGTVYSTTFSIAADCTVKAIAYQSNCTNSEIASQACDYTAPANFQMIANSSAGSEQTLSSGESITQGSKNCATLTGGTAVYTGPGMKVQKGSPYGWYFGSNSDVITITLTGHILQVGSVIAIDGNCGSSNNGIKINTNGIVKTGESSGGEFSGTYTVKAGDTDLIGTNVLTLTRSTGSATRMYSITLSNCQAATPCTTPTLPSLSNQAGCSYSAWNATPSNASTISAAGESISYSWKKGATEKATTASYTPDADGTDYTVTVTVSKAGKISTSVTSSALTATKYAATSISTQPTTAVDATVDVNYTLGSGMVATGEGDLSYQWYSYTSSGGAGEASIGSATSATYTTSKAVAGTYYYKVKVTADCGTVASNMITVTVSEPPCFSATNLVKNGDWSDVAVDGSIDAAKVVGTITGGTIKNTGSAALGSNSKSENAGLVMDGSSKQVTVTLSGSNHLTVGSVITLTAAVSDGAKSGTSKTSGLVVSGYDCSPVNKASETAYDSFTQSYTVTEESSLVEANSFTIALKSGLDKTYLHAITVTGCSDCTPIDPELSYSKTTIWMDDADLTATPTVNKDGSTGSVSFVSGNTDVATVDPSTGVVTAVARGTATITATVAADATHCENTATCDITINDVNCGYTLIAGATRQASAAAVDTYSGPLYKEAVFNTDNTGKISSGKYVYITLTDGHYFQNGDKVAVTITTKSDQGTKELNVCVGTTSPGTCVGVIAAGDVVANDVNEVILSNVPNNTSSITIHRTGNSTTQNPYVQAINVYRYVCPDSKEFLPTASSGNWNATANWIGSDGRGASLPTIDDRVVISKPVTVDIADAKAKDVLVNQYSGATGKITVSAGKALIIAEKMQKTTTGSNRIATAAADVIINSTRAAGTGALVMGSHDGTNAATVNFETKVKYDNGYVNQYLGSPFSDETPYVDYEIQLYKFVPQGNGSHGWWNKLSYGDEMVPFMGYNQLSNNTSGSYLDLDGRTGHLNASSNVEFTIANGKMYYNSSWPENMFANSWTAPIHIDQFIDDDFTNVKQSIYIFNAGTPEQYAAGGSTMEGDADNESAGTYTVIPVKSASDLAVLGAVTTVIPAMQASSVMATSSSPSLTLNFSRLVYTPATTGLKIEPTRAPKRNEERPDAMRLRVRGLNGWTANAYILGREDFTEGYDDGWDGEYMEGDGSAPQLYSATEEGYFVVNCVPEIEGTLMAFHPGSADNAYTFSFVYKGTETWYLNDLKEQQSTLISNETSYPFVSVAGDKAARFVISKTPINKIVTGIDETNGEKDAKVRKLLIDDHIYIIRGGKMYTADGALVK